MLWQARPRRGREQPFRAEQQRCDGPGHGADAEPVALQAQAGQAVNQAGGGTGELRRSGFQQAMDGRRQTKHRRAGHHPGRDRSKHGAARTGAGQSGTAAHRPGQDRRRGVPAARQMQGVQSQKHRAEDAHPGGVIPGVLRRAEQEDAARGGGCVAQPAENGDDGKTGPDRKREANEDACGQSGGGNSPALPSFGRQRPDTQHHGSDRIELKGGRQAPEHRISQEYAQGTGEELSSFADRQQADNRRRGAETEADAAQQHTDEKAGEGSGAGPQARQGTDIRARQLPCGQSLFGMLQSHRLPGIFHCSTAEMAKFAGFSCDLRK